jgi:hypothetical protein
MFDKIDELKSKFLVGNSEELFNIEMPPKYQCPKINELIKQIKTIENLCKTNDCDSEYLLECLADILNEVWSFESDLEEIRRAIDDLRDWGNSWKKEFKYLVNHTDIDLENIYDFRRLEDRLSVLNEKK